MVTLSLVLTVDIQVLASAIQKNWKGIQYTHHIYLIFILGEKKTT